MARLTRRQRQLAATGLAIVAGGLFIDGLRSLWARHQRARCAPRGLPPAPGPAPFAEGAPCPVWPLLSKRERVVSYRAQDGKMVGNAARRFGAPRSSDGAQRKHAGIDLYADVGDIVVATEDGVVTGIRSFFHGTDALYLCTDSGVTVNYGEIAKGSPREFGISERTRVRAGQPLGRVGLMSGGSHMLHLEIYRGCVDKNTPWWANRAPPQNLLDPTDYLLRARQTPVS